MSHSPLEKVIGTLLGLGLMVSSAAAASGPMVDIDPGVDVAKVFGGFDEAQGDGMVGWDFQLIAPFTITQVGWYDQDGDGLSRAFQVGLWQSDPDVPAWSPQTSPLTPPGSPLAIESFFYGQMIGTRADFGPTFNTYAFWGLELGPMVFFGARSGPMPTGLSISRISSTVLLLTWPSGTLQQADTVNGPYTVRDPFYAEKYATPGPTLPQKFYRLAP